MTVDLRRFDYALEPLLRLRRWQLEALQARLGQVVAQLEREKAGLAGLREHYAAKAAQAARASAQRLDPRSASLTLGWLVALRGRIAASERGMQELEQRRMALARDCLSQQQKVDAVERHRADAVADFSLDEAARLASEADREWLTRQSARGGAR